MFSLLGAFKSKLVFAKIDAQFLKSTCSVFHLKFKKKIVRTIEILNFGKIGINANFYVFFTNRTPIVR